MDYSEQIENLQKLMELCLKRIEELEEKNNSNMYLEYRPDHLFTHRHLDEVKRVQEIFLNREKYLELDKISRIWEDYSDTYAAGWLQFPEEDEDIYEMFIQLLKDY